MYDSKEVGLLQNIQSYLIDIDSKLEEQKKTKFDIDLIKVRVMNKLLKELQSFNKIRSESKVSNEKQLKMMTKIKDEVRDLGIVLGNKK